MKPWTRLAGMVPASPTVRYLLVALALAAVVAAAFGIAQRPPSPSTPAATSASKPQTVVPSEPSASAAKPLRDGERLFLPFLRHTEATPTPSSPSSPLEPSEATEPAGPNPTPTPEPVDFAAVRQQLESEGKALAYVKIGFHAGPGGNARGLGEYLGGLAQVGVPAVVKSADSYGVCLEALQTNPENVTVFRMTGGDLELPDYSIPPEAAAQQHWARILEALPPEFDQRTWIEVMNEPDKARADWLGSFAYQIAGLALRDGYRVAAFGWSSGEPEPDHWRLPGMEAYLSLAAQHRDSLAVALHEYSLDVENIANQYPSLVGRFQSLFQACDEMGIQRPTVLITEWGWTAEEVPAVEEAMEDVAWASQLYAAYPEVKGAAIWYLGSGYDGIANKAQRLIVPLRYYAWSEYFVIEPDQKPTDPGVFAPQ